MKSIRKSLAQAKKGKWVDAREVLEG
jgi:hypothetical protein